MIAEFGLGLLWLAVAMAGLVLGAGAVLLSSADTSTASAHRDALADLVRRASIAQAALTLAAFACLVVLFVRSDMSVQLVATHSHSMKPMLYKVAGAWGNHEGSMLLWLTVLSLSGGLVAFFERRLPRNLHSAALSAQAALGLGFYGFLLFASNPFARLAAPPPDGLGLNPLLQDPGLLFHPPTLYIGYVGLSVAFSFAVAALLVRDGHNRLPKQIDSKALTREHSISSTVPSTELSSTSATAPTTSSASRSTAPSVEPLSTSSTTPPASLAGAPPIPQLTESDTESARGESIGSEFARAMRPWVLLSWIFLTLGITAGSYWAYYELGWGGWWFWDPVENVSLIPWLAATALLHSVSVTATRGALRGWTIMLALVGFSMAMFGTFIVRSGVLVSVHSFAVDPERGRFLLFLMGFYIGIGLLLFALRARHMAAGKPFTLLSRESALAGNNLLLIVILLTVLYGTLYPIVAEAMGERISVGPPYFNRVVGPIALALFLLMTIGPLLKWRRDDWQRVRRWLPLIGGSGLVAMVVIWATGIAAASQSSLALAGLVVAAMVAVGTIAPLWKSQMGKSQTHIGLPRWGMVSAHLGVAVALAGAAAESGFSQERLATMAAGDSIEMSGYRFTLQAVNPVAGANWTAIEGEFAMARAQAQARVDMGTGAGTDTDASDSTGAGNAATATTILRPQSRSYPRWSATETSLASGAPTVTNEAALWTNLGGQFYIVISAPMAGDPPQYYRVRLWWKPLVWWIWLGGVMIALGGLLALVGRSQLSLRSLLRRRGNRPHGEQRISGTLAQGEAT